MILLADNQSLGYITSSVEGRVAVEFFSEGQNYYYCDGFIYFNHLMSSSFITAHQKAKKYAFKCHRKKIDGVEHIFPVNCVAFNPVCVWNSTQLTCHCENIRNT